MGHDIDLSRVPIEDLNAEMEKRKSESIEVLISGFNKFLSTARSLGIQVKSDIDGDYILEEFYADLGGIVYSEIDTEKSIR